MVSTSPPGPAPSVRATEETWGRVLATHYGLCRTRLLSEQQHFSRHFVVSGGSTGGFDGGGSAAGEGWGQRRYVLSRVRRLADHPPFPNQFVVLSALSAAGFAQVQRPCRTLTGADYVDRGTHYWCLRRYIDHDPHPDWSCPGMVARAARLLARVHMATAHPWPDRIGLARLEPENLAAFHWSATEYIDRLHLVLQGFDWGGWPAGLRDLLCRTADGLAGESAEVLGAARDIGLVGLCHQDYRPSNLLVRGGEIVAILDWDLARRDHQLYDMAVAALQFGRRQCVFPEVSLRLALQFVDAYLAARGRPRLRLQAPRIVPWMLRLAVLKRVLKGPRQSARDRLCLLRRIEGAELMLRQEPSVADALEPPAGALEPSVPDALGSTVAAARTPA